MAPTPPGFQGLKGAPQNACNPEAPTWVHITCCATAVRRVSEINTTSTRQPANVCHCRRRDVTLASATRSGPGWGSTSPQCSSRRGERSRRHPTETGGGAEPRLPQRRAGNGGEHPSHPWTQLPSVRGREGRGQRGGATKHACRSAIARGPVGPAAPWSSGRRRLPAQGGRAGRRGHGLGGGGGPPRASGRGRAGRRGGRLCSHPSARRLASRATSCRWSSWRPGSTRQRTSGHRAVAQPSPCSSRVARQTSVIRGRRACTLAATSSQVAKGSGLGGGGLAGRVVVPDPAPTVHRHGGLDHGACRRPSVPPRG